MNNRILRLIQELGLSPAQFADEIGVQRSSISHILSGRNKPSLDFVMKIMTAYPEISRDWILFGKGNMESALVLKKPDLFSEIPDVVSSKESTTLVQEESNMKAPEISVVNNMELTNQQETVLENALSEGKTENEKKDTLAQKEEERYPVRLMLLFNDGTFEAFRHGKSETL
ncbi:MAG: helix-turn-helix transcriptional regulator [Bacteroidales bacterium]|nr:helix-turn-helix transcriptional regulator [Bacteroidales bacterium]